jgi:hypothetical protein
MNHPTRRLSALTTAALGLCTLPLGALAQSDPVSPPSSATYSTSVPTSPPPGPAPALAQPIDQLVAPIALYPDPLIAIILPASVNPIQVAQANQFLASGGSPNDVASQPWDDSVRSLAHYPELVQWMADNSQWMVQLGATFASNPSAVMGAIQQLRAVAVANGTLVSTPQQQIVQDNGQIEIEPASPDTIYAPSYDPAVVFVDQPYYGGGDYVSFGDPWVTGAWLGWGFNWEARALWYGGWDEWHGAGGFHAFHGAPPAGVHAWHAPAGARPSYGRVSIGLDVHAVVPPRARYGAPLPPRRAGGDVTIQHSVQPASRPPGEVRAGGEFRDARPVSPRPEARPDIRVTAPPAAPGGREPGRPEPGPRPAPAAERHEHAPEPHSAPRPAPEGRERPQNWH